MTETPQEESPPDEEERTADPDLGNQDPKGAPRPSPTRSIRIRTRSAEAARGGRPRYVLNGAATPSVPSARVDSRHRYNVDADSAKP